MQECILGASGGVTRIMVQQLVDAAIFAIDHDIERIEPALLTVACHASEGNSPPPSNAAHDLPPSEGRRSGGNRHPRRRDASRFRMLPRRSL